MAPCIKLLTCKHENPSYSPQSRHRIWINSTRIYNLALLQGDGRQAQENPWKSVGQLAWHTQKKNNKRALVLNKVYET